MFILQTDKTSLVEVGGIRTSNEKNKINKCFKFKQIWTDAKLVEAGGWVDIIIAI